MASLCVSSYSIDHTLPPLADLTLEPSATHDAPSEPPDLTTIESPIGPFQFAHIPQGWTDAIATATLNLSSKPPDLLTIESLIGPLQFAQIPQGLADTIATYAPSKPPDLLTIESPIGPLQFTQIPQGPADAIATYAPSKPPDLMTIESPFGCLQFAHAPQGWTNAIATDPLLAPNVLCAPCPFLDDDATLVMREHDREDLTDNEPHGTQADAL